MKLDLHLVSPPGFEEILASEARELNLEIGEVETGSVEARGDVTGLYAANVHLRTANRVLVRAASFRATAFHELERGARKIEWARWIGANTSVDVRATCRKSRLYHSDAVAQRVMEAIARTTGASDAAIVDDGEDEGGDGQLVVVRMFHDRCTISIDSSGALLHRRGYRQAVAKAPLRETVAAGMLLAAGWKGDVPLLDPFCGSGTISIEGALIARRIAPNRRRAESRQFAFARWPSFDDARLSALVAAALERELPRAGIVIAGSDRDAGAVDAARANAARAGVEADVAFEVRPISAVAPLAGPDGLVATNPPYGVRVKGGRDARDLFARAGAVLRERLPGWELALLSPDRSLDAQLRVPLDERLVTSNGGIRVRLVMGRIPALTTVR